MFERNISENKPIYNELDILMEDHPYKDRDTYYDEAYFMNEIKRWGDYHTRIMQKRAEEYTNKNEITMRDIKGEKKRCRKKIVENKGKEHP